MNPSHDTQALLSHVGWVRALAFDLVKDVHEAEDLAQDALLAAFEHPPREASSWRGYLRTILRNALLQQRRAGARRDARERSSARAESLPSTSETAARLAAHREVVAAVEALPEPYRGTVLLRYFEERPPREIAALSRVPIKTVHSRLYRAHAMLRARLDEGHGGDRRTWAFALAALSRRPSEPVAAAPPMVVRLALAALAVTAIAGVGLWLRHPAEGESSLGNPSRLFEVATTPGSPTRLDSSESVRNRERIAAPEHRVGLRGRVRTVAGKPVAGADVTVRFRPSDGLSIRSGAFGEAVEELGRVRSGADGRFELAAPSGRPLDVWARADGFGVAHRPLVDAEGDLDFVLEKAGTIALAVRDTDGAPLAGARVELLRTDFREAVHVPLIVGVTDASGRWRCDEVPPGVFSATIRPAKGCVEELVNIGVQSGSVVEREARVRAGVVLEGTVRAADTGLPIPGAGIGTRSLGDRRASSDDQGRYRIDGLASDASGQDVWVEASGFAIAQHRVDARSSSALRADFELTRGFGVRGTLLGPEGLAIEGAWVCAYAKRADGGEPATDWVETRTDDRGAFELAALRPDLLHALIVRHAGHATTIAGLPPQGDRTVLDVGTLRLDVGASLEGVVLRDDGTPAAGAFVDLERETDLLFIGDSRRGRADVAPRVGGSQSVTTAISRPGAEAPDTSRRETLDPALLRTTAAVAGEDGRFRVFDVAPGKVRVLARIGWIRSPPREMELAPGDVARDLRFEIPKGLALSGTVVDDADRPLPGAWILLFREGRSLEDRSEPTGAEGRFHVEGLEAIRYRLQAGYQATGADGALVHPFARTTLADLVPPTSDLVVRLPRTIRIEGRA
jgi:RNA polymerase sigma-70 factor (ECF subfamily)